MANLITLSAGHSTLTLHDNGKLIFTIDKNSQWHAQTFAVLHYYDRQHPRADAVDVPSCSVREYGTAGTLSRSTTSSLSVTRLGEQSAEVTLRFTALSLSIVIRLQVNGSGFTATIPAGGIHEGQPDIFRMLSLELLPEFGAARSGEKGYLTLPNWFGCRTYFNKKYPREVRQTIYSSNDQWENNCNAPVFGITREHGTLCGLIAKGDEDAQLVCRQHWEEAQANSAHPQLMYRWAQEDERIPGDREVRYRFAHADCPEGEGYAFVAMQYRHYLRKDRGIQTWAEKAATRPEALDYSRRFFLKIFMGCKEPHPEGAGTYHCTTTCDEVREIVQACIDRGMRKLAVVLVGWGQDGHDGQAPRYFPVDARVGGADKMRALIQWCQANDVMLGVHTCFTDIYERSPEFDRDAVIRHRSGEGWAGVIWGGGRAHRPCPTAMSPYVERDMRELAELGFHGHHHFDAIGGFKPCYSVKHPLTRRSEFIEAVRANCRLAIQALGSVSTEMPYGQYFDVMDGFFHSHSQVFDFLRGCPMARYFLDDVVPLIGIALHGSHNCGESISRNACGGGQLARHLAKMQGLYLTPSFEVSMRFNPVFGIPTYQGNEEILANAYQFTCGEEGYVTKYNQSDVVGHWELAPGVTKTRYDSGVEVIVNQHVQTPGECQDGVVPSLEIPQ